VLAPVLALVLVVLVLLLLLLSLPLLLLLLVVLRLLPLVLLEAAVLLVLGVPPLCGATTGRGLPKAPLESLSVRPHAAGAAEKRAKANPKGNQGSE